MLKEGPGVPTWVSQSSRSFPCQAQSEPAADGVRPGIWPGKEVGTGTSILAALAALGGGGGGGEGEMLVGDGWHRGIPDSELSVRVDTCRPQLPLTQNYHAGRAMLLGHGCGFAAERSMGDAGRCRLLQAVSGWSRGVSGRSAGHCGFDNF